ncbi:hypothetical protein H4219_003159 [Mycoemilia scoparia]|uniref:Fork-head domain-containing protein n=1 Tax=Mycoemilia scoparia TaxID=417184 RepID=A0A9W8DPN1_9FUNG|nr:hypothetical protein H4219_003159 [Mycoemilia scoparia]
MPGTSTSSKINTIPQSTSNVTTHSQFIYHSPETIQSSAVRKRRRPPYSYTALIAQAILTSPHHRLTLREIYDWIQVHYPLICKGPDVGWQNTIRHNLSLNQCFRRIPRNELPIEVSSRLRGKGSYWTVNEGMMDENTRKRVGEALMNTPVPETAGPSKQILAHHNPLPEHMHQYVLVDSVQSYKYRGEFISTGATGPEAPMPNDSFISPIPRPASASGLMFSSGCYTPRSISTSSDYVKRQRISGSFMPQPHFITPTAPQNPVRGRSLTSISALGIKPPIHSQDGRRSAEDSKPYCFTPFPSPKMPSSASTPVSPSSKLSIKNLLN